jgi:hypothetical protein
MKKELVVSNIKDKIHTIRGKQVILDIDLAIFYEVSTKRLNEQVKRNIARFPKEFMFQLTKEEVDYLVSQNAIGSNNHSLRSQIVTLDGDDHLRSQFATSREGHGGRRYMPYVFTEQGIAMLSGVLRSGVAIQVSIQIMNAFVSMRKFIATNAQIFQRLDRVEIKQLESDKRFNKIFNALETYKPKQGVFFEGQIFDPYELVSKLIKYAKKNIVLIDNYVDESVLTLFSKREKDVGVIIYTKEITEQLRLDLKKFNLQYDPIKIKEFTKSHDRFLIIDEQVYHFGASLKDLGKKWFAFSKIDKDSVNVLDRLEVN